MHIFLNRKYFVVFNNIFLLIRSRNKKTIAGMDAPLINAMTDFKRCFLGQLFFFRVPITRDIRCEL